MGDIIILSKEKREQKKIVDNIEKIYGEDIADLLYYLIEERYVEAQDVLDFLKRQKEDRIQSLKSVSGTSE